MNNSLNFWLTFSLRAISFFMVGFAIRGCIDHDDYMEMSGKYHNEQIEHLEWLTQHLKKDSVHLVDYGKCASALSFCDKKVNMLIGYIEQNVKEEKPKVGESLYVIPHRMSIVESDDLGKSRNYPLSNFWADNSRIQFQFTNDIGSTITIVMQ